MAIDSEKWSGAYLYKGEAYHAECAKEIDVEDRFALRYSNDSEEVPCPLRFDQDALDENASEGPTLCAACGGAIEESVEWSGSPHPRAPSDFWIDDETGERVNAFSGERVQDDEWRRAEVDEWLEREGAIVVRVEGGDLGTVFLALRDCRLTHTEELSLGSSAMFNWHGMVAEQVQRVLDLGGYD